METQFNNGFKDFKDFKDYDFNAEFMKQRENCFDNYVKSFEFQEKNLENLQKERETIEKDFVPFLGDLDNNLFNNYFESAKQYFMRGNYVLVNTGFSKKMWVDDFGTAYGTYNFYGVENVPKVEFMTDVRPMMRTEAISKVREHYAEAKNYGLELDRKSLPVEIDYKALEIFFNVS